MFVCGMAVNIHSDHILRNLRKPGETGYEIPKGGLFNLVSGANFLGEMTEWAGFALTTWSLTAFAFWVFTCCSLLPKAYHHHKHLLLSGQESGWYIPNISFSKDLSHVKEKEFEERFKDLDTGRSVNTTNLDNAGDFTRKQRGSEDVSGDIRKMYNQNVYGLPHNKLMKKV